MLAFLQEWWGLLTVALLGGVSWALLGWSGLKSRLRSLIFMAEGRARDFALKTGKDKMDWVVGNGYSYLPTPLKLFLTEAAFRKVAQYVFNKLVRWAEETLTSNQ